MFLYSYQYLDGAGMIQLKQVITDSAKHARDLIVANMKPAFSLLEARLQFIADEQLKKFRILFKDGTETMIFHTHVLEAEFLFEYFYPNEAKKIELVEEYETQTEM